MSERSAFASLALTQRRLSHGYRRWAAEARDAAERSRWTAEADRLWSGAKWHLARAQERQPVPQEN